MNDTPPNYPLASTANIVDLASQALRHEDAMFQDCNALRAYWDSLRGARQMPARSEFDPRAIENTLASTFVAEKVAPRVARIRVSGSVLNDTLGMDVRGMPITALFDPIARDTVAEAVSELFALPAQLVLDLTSRRSFHRKAQRARMLLLPMSDAEGQVTRIVGCLDIEGPLSKTPRRFKVSALRQTQIMGEAPNIIPLDPPYIPAPHDLPSYAFAEEPISFRSKRSETSNAPVSKGGLRLVVDNA